MLNNFGCILGIGNIMLEASCLKPLENAAVQLDLSYKLQRCFSISPMSRMPLPGVSHASGAALCTRGPWEVQGIMLCMMRSTHPT